MTSSETQTLLTEDNPQSVIKDDAPDVAEEDIENKYEDIDPLKSSENDPLLNKPTRRKPVKTAKSLVETLKKKWAAFDLNKSNKSKYEKLKASETWQKIEHTLSKQSFHKNSLTAYGISTAFILIISICSMYYFINQCKKPCNSIAAYLITIAALFSSLLYHIGVVITILFFIKDNKEQYSALASLALFMILFSLLFQIFLSEAYKKAQQNPSNKSRNSMRKIMLAILIIGFILTPILIIIIAYQLYQSFDDYSSYRGVLQ